VKPALSVLLIIPAPGAGAVLVGQTLLAAVIARHGWERPLWTGLKDTVSPDSGSRANFLLSSFAYCHRRFVSELTRTPPAISAAIVR
jgi:hypothetical protein